MQPIFKDELIQQEFDKNGFVKIKLLDIQQINNLKDFYHEHSHNTDQAFHVTLDQTDPQQIKAISNRIESELNKSVQEHFKNYQIFTASFVVKEPGKKNIVPPHQDWSFVDEASNYSVTCWTPLIDVDQNNGALAIIKGTHKVFTAPRSSPSPESKSILSDHIFTLFPYVETINLIAGESLVFDNRLIHASTPNLSESSRIAVGIGLTGKNAELKHYYENPQSADKEILEYTIDTDFFYKWNNKNLSTLYNNKLLIEDYKQIKSIAGKIESYTKTEMDAKIKAIEGVSYNQELMDHLSKLFNYNTTEKQENKMDNTENKEVENKPSKDHRNFFQIYTPVNIIKEIAWRLKGRPQ